MVILRRFLHVASIWVLPHAWLVSNAAPLNPGTDAPTYIVKLKNGVDPNAHLASLGIERTDDRVFAGHALNGYTARLTDSTVSLLKEKYSQEIEYVEKDQTVQLASKVVQSDAPWGLQRISQSTTLSNISNVTALNYTYIYDSKAGEGIDIYIFDTGVYAEHEEFAGRITRSPMFSKTITPGDFDGHGTHCAATAAGTKYGVAKKAHIIDVKVFPDEGFGQLSYILSGLDWAVSNAKTTNRTGVISMSLGVTASKAFEDTVRSVISSGLTVVVSAGNSASPASEWSPANVEQAITVGNVEITGRMWPYSNYGSAVDIFAPGTNVVSAGLGNPRATKIDSGTSMSAPHVAGIAAYLLSLEGPRTPAGISARIKELAVPGIFGGLPPNTTNLVAQLPF
ncbi:subtilisin-like protease 8 [Ceratobasidium sp. AG-Ba]|nr:subtilisin-like protease 8 [Ceratobasidium sp. AG-Ba]